MRQHLQNGQYKSVYLVYKIFISFFFSCICSVITFDHRYKNKTRREEIKTLIQGKTLPPQYQLAKEVLPSHRERPTVAPVEPNTPEEIPDQDDMVGQATVGRAVIPPQTTPKCISRTTEWRQRKRIHDQLARQEGPVEKAPRKEYTCRVCNQAMVRTGHTQFRGKRYCPNAPGQIPKEDWLTLRKAEAEAKKEASTWCLDFLNKNGAYT